LNTSVNNPVLAIYDFRSKQEYIYRTNKIREISGASRLLEDIYKQMIERLNKVWDKTSEKVLFYDNDDNYILYNEFMENNEYLGQVLYKGGGNLMMLYRNKETYLKANRIISRMVIEKSHTLQLIAACVDVDESLSFNELRSKLYEKLAKNKRSLVSFSPCNVTPFTQIDITSHQAISVKKSIKGEGEVEFTREAYLKREAFLQSSDPSDKSTKELDDAITEKGEESLLAVIYIDGNDIGNELMNALSGSDKSFDSGVLALREFAKNIHQTYVTEPINEFNSWLNANRVYLEKTLKSKWYYRRVIGGGDEITIICNARLALKLVQLYFDALGRQKSYSACAGISIFHSHAPFTAAYEIAEECCENAKEFAKKSTPSASCLDFFFCRSGLTNDLEGLRSKEDGHVTGLPYNVGEFLSNIQSKIIPVFNAIGRSNAKALNAAILKGDNYYMLEVDRINAYCGRTVIPRKDAAELKNLIFDASCVYDIWFANNMDYSIKEAGSNEA